MSDVCKHCTNAGCLDACPTGALIRTEFETVVAAGRRLQRLRLLHPLVPVRRHRPRPLRRPRRQVHALLRPPRGRARAGLRQGVPDRLDPVRPLRRAGRDGQGPRRRAARARGRERLPVRRGRRRRAEQLAGGLGAFFLLTEPPERFGLPAQADSPIQENGPVGEPRRASPPRSWPPAGRSRACVVAHRRRPPVSHLRRKGRRRGGDPARASAAALDGRDVTPARRHARPARRVPARGRGRQGGAGQAALGRRALVVPVRPGHALRGRPAPTTPRWRAPRAPRARRRRGPDVTVQGPMMQPAVWTWEVPLYFWLGGIAARLVADRGVACDVAGDHALGGGRAQGGARRGDAGRAAADPRPRPPGALLQHAADLQAALADVDGRVVPDGLLDRRRRRRRRRPARRPREAGARARRR